MKIEIVDKATGRTNTVDGSVVSLTTPSIVRVDLARTDIAAFERDGNDLILVLADGERVRIGDFYRQAQAAPNDLVLRDGDGSLWLAHPAETGAARFSLLHDVQDLTAVAASGDGGGGGSFVLPAVLGLAGAGGLAAAVAGGGGGTREVGASGGVVDSTPPDRPTATFTRDGTGVSGTGEAGAAIQVRNAAGALIGAGTVGANGSYSVTLDQPRTNGEAVSVTQADAAGNVSPPATAVAPDLTAPAAPTAAIDAAGIVITGTGEAGATVRVVDAAGTVLGTAVVGTNGSFAVTLASPQVAGSTLSVTQADAAGNVSPATALPTSDLVAPAAPVVTIAPDGSVVTGRGEPGATVTARGPDGTVLGTGPVGADGSITLPLSPAQANGGTVTVVQADPAGNMSTPVTVAAPDITAPAAPVATVSADGTTVSGTGEPGASVTITTPAGSTIGTGTVGTDGSYTAVLTQPQRNGETIEVRQVDPTGNSSAPSTAVAPDLTAPAAPAAAISIDGTQVTGSGEAGATVTVRDAAGTAIGSATVAADGSYAVTLSTPQIDSQTLNVSQVDPAGNASPAVPVTAPDLTAPAAPVATIAADGITISGTGEPGASISVTTPAGATVATATVGTDGRYTAVLMPAQRDGETVEVRQSDAAGNVSTPSTAVAPDLTAPAAPLATITADGTQVTGTGEPGATVTVRDAAGTVIGSATIAADGSYAAPLTPAQIDSQPLSVVQTDPAGNGSPGVALTAPDLTAPAVPTAMIDASGAVVMGTGEPGASVVIRDVTGAPIGTATVTINGTYAAPLVTPLVNGETVSVVQADAAGNASLPASTVAPDLTAPAAPSLSVGADGASAAGTGEPGATVTVTDAAGTSLGSATIGADGQFTVQLTPAQANGGTVIATQSDAAGNVSPPATAAAPDITPPAAPVAALDATGAFVTGSGEAGATITVRDAGGATIGTATADARGAYTVVLTTPQIDSQALSVTQADAAGNPSPATPLTAPDLTAPAAPVGTVSGDGTQLSGTGEAGATVTITDPIGVVIATVTVDAVGQFTAPLVPAQVNGELLTLTQADAAGNVSPTGTALAPDLVLNDSPPAPTAVVDATGTIVTGTGQAGATITVRGPGGVVIGTAIVDGNGTYAAPLAPAQLNGETVRVTQADAEGDVSPPAIAIAPDLTAPAAPTAAIDTGGQIVTGTGEAGATVRVTDAGGVVIATTVVGANGAYATVLDVARANGEALSVTQADAAGNISPAAPIVAPDFTAPAAPAAIVAADGLAVTGTGEPGATVTVRDATGAAIGTGVVAADGSYVAALTTAQVNGEALTITQADAAGNVSPTAAATAPDLTAPDAPTATVESTGTVVIGTGEPGATVTIRDAAGTPIGTATVGAGGSYTAVLTTAQANGEQVQVTQADAAGNVSPTTVATAPDITAPAAPTGLVGADGTTIGGTGEPGATVTIRDAGGAIVATGVVSGDGSYTATLATPQANGETLRVTQADAAGNVSPAVTVIAPDITAPTGLTAIVDASGTIVAGVGEAGASVVIRDAGGATIGTTTVAANGTYMATLTVPQVNGQTVQVTQADAAGNVSAPVPALAPDITAPLAPIGTVNADGSILSGTGEAGATVTIRASDGTVLATALVAADGSFAAPLTPAQANGETLRLTQADAAGNVSPETTALAPDITAPVGLTAAVDGTGLIVAGLGEAGAAVTIRDTAGNPIGTATVAANGTYSATLTAPQLNGQTVQVTQADAAGNVSAPVAALAPDITAPFAPIATVGPDGTVVTGTGEAGATISVADASGAVIGTALVGADGTYTATLATPQANGETVIVTQADAAGNVSPAVAALAPDITPPALPTAAIDTAGAVISGTGEPGATVEVRDAAGTVIATGPVSAGGGYAITLPTPQVAGEALTVDQRDPAGNQSGAVGLTAPFDITAFDNAASASITLEPVQADRTLGGASYLALVSLGALNLDAQVLAVPSIGFTVAAGHTLDATFTYDATLSIGALSGYAVVVQRFDGSRWVAVDGTGTSTTLDVRLLDGNLIANEALAAGQYRAFVTFDGTAGVGLLGGLSATGVDSDFTQAIALPGTIAGNVVTDPGPGGAVDVVSPQTVVASVTVGGVTTAVTRDGTVVDGAWGKLVINRDGSYTYTADANAAAIGKTDVFTYQLIDLSDGEVERANLSIAIGSPEIAAAPVASHDTAIAAATFANVVETVAPFQDRVFTTPVAGVTPQTGSVTHTFTVDANSASTVTLSAVAQTGISLLPSYTITVTNPQGVQILNQTLTAVAGLPVLGGTGVSVTLPNLTSGSYTYTVSSTHVLSGQYDTGVYIGQTVTHFDQHQLTGTTPVQGDLLANDATGSAFFALQVAHGGAFVEVPDSPLTIAGTYGSLTVDAAGHYTYQPSTTLAYAVADPVDSFTYQIVQPNGTIATAQIDIAVDINNGATPVLPATAGITEPIAFAVPDTDVMALGMAAPLAPSPVSHATASALTVDLDDQATVHDLLGRFLDAQGATDHAAPVAPAEAAPPTPAVETAVATLPEDPLAYIVPADPDHDRLVTLHAA
ncbi:BapA/Bap/LapF family large adhesin [Sphingomonas beigongshangi]|uniref:BapA/Bap/LapF family large adhesin n=1 Tax=Sphingomonas beigongshangi TaxID=2782540 RepID=UPI001AEDE13A|nr:BapA/Bap/LapF family large adhesin [Sphingomonas beigongshangi]